MYLLQLQIIISHNLKEKLNVVIYCRFRTIFYISVIGIHLSLRITISDPVRWGTSWLELLHRRFFQWTVTSLTSMIMNMTKVLAVRGFSKWPGRNIEKDWLWLRSLRSRTPLCPWPATNKSWRNWRSDCTPVRTVCLFKKPHLLRKQPYYFGSMFGITCMTVSARDRSSTMWRRSGSPSSSSML